MLARPMAQALTTLVDALHANSPPIRPKTVGRGQQTIRHEPAAAVRTADSTSNAASNAHQSEVGVGKPTLPLHDADATSGVTPRCRGARQPRPRAGSAPRRPAPSGGVRQPLPSVFGDPRSFSPQPGPPPHNACMAQRLTAADSRALFRARDLCGSARAGASARRLGALWAPLRRTRCRVEFYHRVGRATSTRWRPSRRCRGAP